MKKKDRIGHLTQAALELAERDGLDALRRDAIAAHAGVSFALVTHQLGTMPEVRRRVMRAAVQHKTLRVLADGLAARDKQALRMPDELKREVALWLAARR